jgi:uroporphyrinogen-III synthase
MNTSLKNLRILNTRPLGQEKSWSLAIKNAGGIAIEFPLLAIEYLPSDWTKTLPNLNLVDFAIFISVNAVNACFTILEKQQIIWPANIQVIAIGKATAKALIEQGIRVDFTPSIEDSEHLLSLPCLQNIAEKNILLFKGEGGRSLIEETLISRDAKLTIVPVYIRSLPDYKPEFIDLIWQNDAVDIILLTSEAAIENLFTLFQSEAARTWLCNKPCLVISERLANKATAIGIKTLSLLKE